MSVGGPRGVGQLGLRRVGVGDLLEFAVRGSVESGRSGCVEVSMHVVFEVHVLVGLVIRLDAGCCSRELL